MRPKEMEGGKRVNVYLDKQSIEIAKKIGGGNLSAGIRKAINDGDCQKPQAKQKVPGLVWAVVGKTEREVKMCFDTPEQANAFVAGIDANLPLLALLLKHRLHETTARDSSRS